MSSFAKIPVSSCSSGSIASVVVFSTCISSSFACPHFVPTRNWFKDKSSSFRPVVCRKERSPHSARSPFMCRPFPRGPSCLWSGRSLVPFSIFTPSLCSSLRYRSVIACVSHFRRYGMSICEKSVLEFGMDAHAAYMHVNTPQSYPFRCRGKRDSDGGLHAVHSAERALPFLIMCSSCSHLSKFCLREAFSPSSESNISIRFFSLSTTAVTQWLLFRLHGIITLSKSNTSTLSVHFLTLVWLYRPFSTNFA